MTLGNDNGTDGETDGQTDRQTDRVRRIMRPPPREEGRIISYSCALSTVCNVAETSQRSLDRLDIRRFDNKPSAATLCALFKKNREKNSLTTVLSLHHGSHPQFRYC